MDKIKIIENEKCFIESNAIEQLKSVSNLDNVIRAVGLPDLHYGKGPIGAAIDVRNKIYPHLIGNDIGCGMMFIKSSITKRKFKKDKIIKKLEKIENLKNVENINNFDDNNTFNNCNNINKLDNFSYLNNSEEKCPIVNFGTIGGGNHFAEFQILNEVFDNDEFEKLNFNKDDIMMLVHCGSRNYGEEILKKYINYDGLDSNSKSAKEYLKEHDNALVWARLNRKEVADKLINYLGFSSENEVIIDCYHNFIEQKDDIFIHRKGAVSSEKGLVIIPGSRGSLSYIVKPTNNTEISGFSLCHGAGRKWPRNLCKGRLENKYTKESIKETKLKSSVICHDSKLLYEEAAEAYKNIDAIINCLVEYDLIKVVATMKPLITFKG